MLEQFRILCLAPICKGLEHFFDHALMNTVFAWLSDVFLLLDILKDTDVVDPISTIFVVFRVLCLTVVLSIVH